MHSSCSSGTDRWVHFQQNAGLRLFVHTWIVQRIDDCYQLTRTWWSMYFHHLPRYQLYFVLLFLCVESRMLQLIIEYKLVCPRKLELDSSPPSCCSIAVIHCASLPIKKYLCHSQLCPFIWYAGNPPGYCGVGCGIEVGWRCGEK